MKRSRRGGLEAPLWQRRRFALGLALRMTELAFFRLRSMHSPGSYEAWLIPGVGADAHGSRGATLPEG